jgi:hypothetical protein
MVILVKNLSNFFLELTSFFGKMVDRKVIPFDEFYYQLKLMYLFLLHVVYSAPNKWLLKIFRWDYLKIKDCHWFI